MSISIKNGNANVCIDGEKFLELLGLSEDAISGEDGAILVRDALLSKTDEEREKIFTKASSTTHNISFVLKVIDNFSNEHNNVENYYKGNYVERSIKDIKRDIKKCKNYMQKKVFQQELNIAYRNKKKSILVNLFTYTREVFYVEKK